MGLPHASLDQTSSLGLFWADSGLLNWAFFRREANWAMMIRPIIFEPVSILLMWASPSSFCPLVNPNSYNGPGRAGLGRVGNYWANLEEAVRVGV